LSGSGAHRLDDQVAMISLRPFENQSYAILICINRSHLQPIFRIRFREIASSDPKTSVASCGYRQKAALPVIVLLAPCFSPVN
jgi:hypothetical protein